MIKEALEFLTRQANLAAGATRLLDDEGEDDPRAALFLIGGATQVVNLPEPPRDHSVKSLDDFVAMAADHVKGDRWPEATVFVAESDVTCVLDNDSYRVERFRFELKRSDVWETVCRMADWKDQKAFIRLLKIDLRGVIAESSLLEIVRKITFENGSVVTSEVKKNRESLGKEIQAKVQSASGEIPDEVTLGVRVYKSLGEGAIYGIECSVEVDPMRGVFKIAPCPDELERVSQLAVGSILSRLRESLPECVPCYYGSP